LITTSGSGLDPHLSPEAALFQARRVAEARGMPVDDVLLLMKKSTAGPQFGFLGEPRVRILELNLSLDDSGNP
jgi:K+-transporting ATPase ATPase C chain